MSERVRTAQNVELDLKVASFGDRVLAALTDYVLLYAVVILLFVGFAMLVNLAELSNAVMGVFAFLVGLPVLFYFLLFEIFFDGQTPGKRVRGIRVVTRDGGTPTIGQYLLRWILRPIDIHLASGAVGSGTILISERNQRLGDMTADTLVVKEEKAPDLSSVRERKAPEEYGQLTYPRADQLSTEDIATARKVKDVLRRDGLTPKTARLCRDLQEILTRKMGVSTTDSPRLFLQTVIHDYEALHTGNGHSSNSSYTVMQDSR